MAGDRFDSQRGQLRRIGGEEDGVTGHLGRPIFGRFLSRVTADEKSANAEQKKSLENVSEELRQLARKARADFSGC